MDTYQNTEIIDSLVKRYFAVDDITLGSAKEGYIFRYRGHFVTPDTAAAYDELAGNLKPYQLIPLFRNIDDRQAILLVSAAPAVKPGKPWINLIFFIITLLSVLVSGGFYNQTAALPSDPIQLVAVILNSGWPFAVSLLAILGSHEFGHYIAGRLHGQKVSLPFFIPLWFSFPRQSGHHILHRRIFRIL